VEFFHRDLVAWKHYIPVKRDLSDLLDRVQWAFDHPEECDRMAEAAQAFAVERFTYEKIMERIYYVYRNIYGS
jgi:glycosyltransferase involved in cell wall biosynthesis